MRRRQSAALTAALGLACVVLIVLGVLQRSGPKLDVVLSFNPSAPTSNVWVRFDASEASRPDGSDLSSLWDFGDGTQETGGTVYHRFALAGTYFVQLTAMDKRGASKTAVKHLTVESPDYDTPIAVFTYLPSTAVEGEIVRFQALSICRPECTIIEYAWDFGDGTSRLGAAQRHAFAEAGTYVVRLTIADISGATDEAVREVTVHAAEN